MDIVSHGLWGNLVFKTRTKKQFALIFIFSCLPDFLSEGVLFLFILFKFPGMPNLESGHPNITDFPLYAQNFYNFTHSLVIFFIVFFLIWAIQKKPLWILGTWFVHIVIDIPTHSFELFPTPFLWPVFDFKFNGIHWGNPIVLIVDCILIVIIYLALFFPRIKKLKKSNV